MDYYKKRSMSYLKPSRERKARKTAYFYFSSISVGILSSFQSNSHLQLSKLLNSSSNRKLRKEISIQAAFFYEAQIIPWLVSSHWTDSADGECCGRTIHITAYKKWQLTMEKIYFSRTKLLWCSALLTLPGLHTMILVLKGFQTNAKRRKFRHSMKIFPPFKAWQKTTLINGIHT